MKTGVVVMIVLSVCGVISAFIFSEPVPDGITEPAKYRKMMATFGFYRLLISAAHLLHQDEPFPSFYVKSIRYIREKATPTPPAEVSGSNIRSRVIDLDGVSARLYEPIVRSGAANQPAFVFLHGGGMCLGSADEYDSITRKIAEGLDIVVISINYRLAPEHPFPAGYEDCVAATRYFIQHAHDYNVDPRRIGIGGDSAGGHLSAAVSAAIHDDSSLPDLQYQVLIYPFVQAIDLNTPSYQKYAYDFGDGGILPLSLIVTFMGLTNMGVLDPDFYANAVLNNHTSSAFKMTSVQYGYVNHDQLPIEFRDPRYYTTRNDPHTGNDALWARLAPNLLDPRGSALMRGNLTGLPPAYIVTCGFDLLRDDGVFYKNRLEEAGVPVTWSHYEDGFHDVLSMTGPGGFTLATTMLEDIITYIRGKL